MLTKSQENLIFKDARNGYGFEEVNQTIEGVYCAGCSCIHKRPITMWSNGIETLCKIQVVRLWNPNAWRESLFDSPAL